MATQMKSEIRARTHRWINQAAFLAMSLVVCSSAVCAAPPGWTQTWGDEFDGKQVDATKWDKILWKTPYNNEQQAYDVSRVSVEDGSLVLTADDADFGGKSYTSGKVESKFKQQYGRWEVRAKLPGTKGTWPAIWLLPDVKQNPWPSQGEIDILEHRGDKPTLTTSAYHWGPDFHGRKFLVDDHEASEAGKPVDYTSGFHTYAVEWDKQQLKFFVDDVLHYTIQDEETDGFLGRQTAPVEVHLNVAVGGDYVDEAQPDDSSVWPQQMLVDYVRVYTREGDASTGDARKSRIDLNSRNSSTTTTRELQ